MKHISNDLITLCKDLHAVRSSGRKIAFVPTMGNLHSGHMALIAAARDADNYVVVSIFVNPAQFGENEDLSNYPRTLQQDIQLLEAHTDLLFTPATECIYPQGSTTYVDIPDITQDLCGQFRPIHFRGVLTIVNILFHLIQPNFACFGKKDFQQMRLIQRMVNDFHMDITILEVDTGREPSGLACSSRNQYLSPSEKEKACILYRVLVRIKEFIENGNTVSEATFLKEKTYLHGQGFVVDYLEVRDHATLKKPISGMPIVILIAARLGKTRLIDNIEV